MSSHNGDIDIDATPRPARSSIRQAESSRAESVHSVSTTATGLSHRPAPPLSGAKSSREIEDLYTKIKVLEKRRLEDRDKLKTLVRIQEERDRFEGIIQRLQLKYQPQQQELADLQKKLEESDHRFAGVESMQADHDAELENATLDREMAEEQYEAAKADLTALREKYEEAELELEVLREENQELGREMSTDERNSQGFLQLERSNERYREALIRLREVTQDQEAELKAQITALEKDLLQFAGINEATDALRAKLQKSEEVIDDLKQQLEAAQAGEEMLMELSDRNMTLQDKIEDLNATVQDLQDLKELNDELEVNHVEAEKQMQEEIDFKSSVINDQLKRAQDQQNAMDDYEMTVAKFREAFRNMQTDLADMKASKEITDTEADDLNSKSKALMDLNLKLQKSALKTQVKAMDLELQRLDAEEATQHLGIVRSYLPDSYKSDRDCVLALLRLKRLAFKAKLIHDAIREKAAGRNLDEPFFGLAALDRLIWINSMSQRLINTMNESSLEHFSSFGTALYELEPVERSLNGYIGMLKKEEISMKQIDDELQRLVAVVSHLASTLLVDSASSQADNLVMETALVQSHFESATSALLVTKSLVEVHVSSGAAGDRDTAASESDFGPFFERIEAVVSQVRAAKVIASKSHRELVDLRARSLALPPDSLTKFENARSTSEAFASFTRVLGQRLFTLVHESVETPPLTPRQVASIVSSTATEVFALSQPEAAPLSTMHDRMTSTLTTLTHLHTLTTDLPSTHEFTVPSPPWIIRSAALRSATEADSHDRQEVSRLSELLQARALALRAKDAELDEQSVRIEMLEARMKSAAQRTRRIEELEARLADAGAQIKTLGEEAERLGKEAKRLREERDEAKLRAVDAGGAGGTDVGDLVVGRAAGLELERKSVQIQGLRAAVRYLHQHQHRGSGDGALSGADTEWLRGPLVPRDAAGERRALARKEGRDVMLQLLHLAVANSAPVALATKGGGDRLKWRPVRESSAWVVGRRREEYEVWSEWAAKAAREARACGGK